MSPEVKRVKILTLLEMALGLALLACGIVLAVMGSATAAPYVLCGEGALTLLAGGRGSLIANVPARIGSLATLALVVLLAQVACVVGVMLLVGPDNVQDNLLPVVAAAVPAALSLVVAVLSRGIDKRAER